MKRVTNSYL